MSTSRKRSKASKGKKASPVHGSSRPSLGSKGSSGGAGVGAGGVGDRDGGSGSNRDLMPGLAQEGGDKPGVSSTGGGGGSGGGRSKGGKAKGVSADRDRDRLVYFDPAIILPPADKRSGKKREG